MRCKDVVAASMEQAVSAFDREHVLSVRRQLAAVAFASTLSFQEAAEAAGCTDRLVKQWAVSDQAFIQTVSGLMKRRMERMLVNGDELVAQLQEIAKEARAKGQQKEAIAAIRTIAEMSGLIGSKVLNATQNKTVNYNFGARPEPALEAEVVEVLPE